MTSTTRKTGAALWVLQGLLAALFLFAGGVKLLMPAEALEAQSEFPALFLRFIAVCELLGAFGLVLPGLLNIRPGLTPLAALGLVVIMIGATVSSAATLGVTAAVAPFVVGVLCGVVAWGRAAAPARVAVGAPATRT